jgi:hypothetical protein
MPAASSSTGMTMLVDAKDLQASILLESR